MKLVVTDTSVVAAWLFEEEGSERALDIYRGFRDRAITCLAPDLLLPEIGSVARKKVQRGLSSYDGAMRQVRLFLKLDIRYFSCSLLLTDAVAVACRESITVYDSLYLSLAQGAGAELATFDGKLSAAATRSGIRVCGS